MKRLLFILLMAAIGGMATAQEGVDYRGQYAKLFQAYIQDPNDIATLTALSDFFADPANPQHDLAQAKRHIHRADSLFEKYLQDDRYYRIVSRLIRNDITLTTLRTRQAAVDNAAYAYLNTHARDISECQLAAFAEAFADDKAIPARVERLRIGKAYSRVKEENTIDGYYTFILEHPGTPEADSADSRIKPLATVFFSNYDNEGDILTAVQQYPESPAMQQAAMFRRSLIAYTEACRLNTVGAYSEYIERFPQGSHYVQALLHLEELNAAEFNSLATPQDYADYALQHSDSPLADSAIARLRRMIVEEHSKPAVQVYLQNFPLDPARSDIYNEYYRWHAAEGNGAPLLRFAEENPGYPYRLTLLSDLARARIVDSIDLLPNFSEKDYDTMATNIYRLTGRRIAFVGLQHILQQQIAREDWAGAKARWEHFGICFEELSTSEYNALGTLLAAPSPSLEKRSIAPGHFDSPCVSPDGKTLYLVATQGQTHSIIYLHPSTQKGTPWAFGGDVTLRGLTGDITHCAIAPDGRHAYLTIDDDIWTARIVRDTLWEIEARLPYPVNTDRVETDAYPLADGSGLLLASDREGGHNCQPSRTYFHGDTALATDLWFIPRTPAGWGEPVNLGMGVNTPYCERSPLLSSNGRTLYFISDGPVGFGRGDIFRVTRTNTDDWTRWGKPVNLGKGVNGPFAEQSIAFAEKEQRLVVCSATPTAGTNRCFSIPIHHDTTGSLRPVRLDFCNVKGEVQHVDIIDLTRQSVVKTFDRQSLASAPVVQLDKNHRYAVIAQAPGFFVPAVDVPSPMPRSIAPKGYTATQALGATIPLGATPYDAASSPCRVLPVADYELQQLAIFLIDNPTLNIQIEVHVRGKEAQRCYDTSVEVAAAIRTRLAEFGIATDRIRLAGYGNVMYQTGKHPAPVAVRFFQ